MLIRSKVRFTLNTNPAFQQRERIKVAMILMGIRIQTEKKYMQNNSIYVHKIQFQAATYI